MKVEFSGLEEIRGNLSKLANSEHFRDEAVKEGADYFKGQLEENVYALGLKQRTGRSKESFIVDNKVVDGTIEVGLSNQANDAFYLYFHENGTSKMPARPFMRPTFENEKGNIEKKMAEVVQRGLRL